MAAHDDIFWYAIDIFVSVLTPSVLYLWNCCCGNVCGGLHSWLFMLVAEKFDVEEHRFDGVSNLGAMSRILRQAGLRTGRHRWNHDANADSGDNIQVGTIRFPTKSYCLWSLALLGITHYIWMKDDGSVIVITGPREAVNVLIRMSNSAVNRQATEAQIAELIAVLGDGPMELKCRLLDRVLVGALSSILAFILGFSHSTYLHIIGVVCGFVGCSCICYNIARLRGISCRSCVRWMCRKLRRQVDPEAAVNLLPAVPMEGEVPAIDDWDWESSNEKRYSLVVARVSWYEIHTQLLFQSEFLPFRSGDFHTGVKALAIKQNNHLPQLAAHYFSSDPDLLYVCVHNPMTDLNIIEMKELIVKAKRDILILIILPVCEPFSAQLDNFPPAGLHAHNDARFVTSLAGMDCWLTMLSARVFSKFRLVLPYHDQETLKSSSLWRIMTKTVNSEILHLSPDP